MFALTPEDTKQLCKTRHWFPDSLVAYQRSEIYRITVEVAGFAGYSGMDEDQQPPERRSDLVEWLEVGLSLLSDDYNKNPEIQFPEQVQEAFEAQVTEDLATLAACRRWLAATPYMVWCFYQDVQGAAQDALEGVLLDLASEGSRNLKRDIEEAVDRAKRKFIKQYQETK